MRTRRPLGRWDLSIGKKDRVLEVGSGHSPSYRAHVLVEKYLTDNFHRCGDIKVYANQILVNADGENLPFREKEFDYVICNQVLEHVDNPARFIGELERVSKRGYIETPSLLGEFLFPKEAHKWVILDIDDKLVFFEKSRMPGNYKNNYGELFLNYLPYQSFPYKVLGLTEGNLMINRYEWKDHIDILVNPEKGYYYSFFTQKWTREMAEKLFPPRGLGTEMRKFVRSSYYLIKEKLLWKYGRRSKLLTLQEYRQLKGK